MSGSAAPRRRAGAPAAAREDEAGPRAAAPTPPPFAAVLALQRSAGNRAMTRVLQRRVGFEFEDMRWQPWKLTGKANNPRVNPVERKESVHQGPGYKLEGDDSSGPTDPSAEFVTEPFEETDTGLDAAHQAMISMATLSGHLDGHVGRAGPADGTLPDAPYTATEHARYVTGATIGVAGGKVPTDRVLFSKGTAGGAVKMQVTSGISLAALPTAMRYLGGEQDNESGAQTADRTPGRDALYRTITEPIDVVGAAPDLATQALQNLRNALNAVNPAAGATLGASAQLEGLLAALMMTLKMLQVPIDGPIKYRLPLMARTNFAAMFESLPKPQRRLLKTEHARLTTAILAASNAQPLISQTMGVLPDTGLTAGSPLIRSATRPPNFPGEIVPPKPDVAFAPVTIGEWIKGITHGHDYLAPSEMDKFLKKANTPSATRDDVLKNRQLLESFGSVGKMDKRGKTPLAVFENRGISPTPAPYTMPLAAALRIAWNQLLFFKALREHPNAPGAYPDEDVGVRPGEND